MPRQRAELELRQMLKAIRHESFYETGTWCDESLGVYVGWAVQQDSFSRGMPITNEREDVILVFSGEEFPEPATARDLKARGHEFDEDGPDYLVHLYEEDVLLPGGLERKVPRTPGGSHARHGDAVQRPVRDAPGLLPRVT